MEIWTEMAEKGRDAEVTLGPFYKEFGRGRNIGPNVIETGVHNFLGGSTPAETKGFCS